MLLSTRCFNSGSKRSGSRWDREAGDRGDNEAEGEPLALDRRLRDGDAHEQLLEQSELVPRLAIGRSHEHAAALLAVLEAHCRRHRLVLLHLHGAGGALALCRARASLGREAQQPLEPELRHEHLQRVLPHASHVRYLVTTFLLVLEVDLEAVRK